MKQGGFTLIDVLVSIVVLSIGFLALIQAVTTYAKHADRLKERTFAHWTALNAIEMIRLQGVEAFRQGYTETMGRKERRVTVQVESGIGPLRRIKVGTPDGRVSLVTYLPKTDEIP